MTESQSFLKLQRYLQTVRALVPKSPYSQDNATNVMAPENEIIDFIHRNELYFKRNMSFIRHCLDNFLENTNSQNEECVKKCLHILQKMSEETNYI